MLASGMQAPASAIARQWQLGVKINALQMNASGTGLALALGDGAVALLAAADIEQTPEVQPAHPNGVSLCLTACGDMFVSGGDDGRVMLLTPGAPPRELAKQSGRWIDCVAATPGADRLAYSYSKQVQLTTVDGEPQGPPKLHSSSIGGLAFSPNGKRLAVAHKNGVSLWWAAATEQNPVMLNWQGSHLLTCWSPDGKMVLTAMQESALHGWRLSDMNEMRMQGYPGRIYNLAWARGRWLVTSGAAQAVCWPFFGGGPWGKAPQPLGLDRGVIVRWAQPHPRDDLVAVGYADGMIELAPLDGRPGVMIHPPVAPAGHEIIGLAWNVVGDCLFAATADGYAMLFTIDSVAGAVRQ